MKRDFLSFLAKYQSLFLTSVAIVGGITGLRLLGGLQSFELQAFDGLMQLRPVESADTRIVIVGVSDTDLQTLGSTEIPDQAIADLITKISAQQPRVIGLDFYRNLPVQPGHARLLQVFRQTPNLIGITKVGGDAHSPPIAGNSILEAAGRIAASDVLADPDGRVRRGLIVPNAESSHPIYGFGFKIALHYLAALNIKPDSNPAMLTIAGVTFPPFAANDGGYVRANDRGYQILLNLRTSANLFQRVSMTDVLRGTMPTNMMRDKIVLIGSTLPGNSDAFYTAHSGSFGATAQPMYGVDLHANIASQIISAVLDQRPTLRVLPKWLELVLIAGFAVLGAWVHWAGTTDFRKISLTLGLMGLIFIGGYWLILEGWWLPVVPVSLALAGASIVTTNTNARQFKTLSTRDELTKLANRRMFNEQLEREWSRSLRSQTSLAIILCDVDYFKLYNDTYGHPQGDDCLRQVARALKQSVGRSHDLVARYGGEEFVILLPNTDANAALQVAEHVRALIKSLKLPHPRSQVSDCVTLSLGIACVIPSLDIAPGSLVKQADLGLYEAKQQGRDRAILQPFSPL
ncbi:MAG: diguanylate cyclase [Leptolyngbyaceae cyanobacterium bins.349]|nr:diguanylate cyclase [Leptolyngbyaceae cyanobacterium bins.349]